MGKNKSSELISLRTENNQLTAQIHDLTAENQVLATEVERLKQKLERMNELLLNAQRSRFGQSSEKRTYVLPNEEQLRLFNEVEAVQDPKEPEPVDETPAPEPQKPKKKNKERKSKRTIADLLKDHPAEEVLLDLDENQKNCPMCGQPLTKIGKKLLRYELDYIPAQVKIRAIYTVTYACRACETETGYAGIYRVSPPPTLMKHSLASASTVADVMTKKYADGLPLARQEKIWARAGIELSRATLANWVIQCAQTWLKPVYRRLKRYLLEGKVIHADETPVQVLKETGKAPTAESRMWVYASNGRGGRPIRYFEYQPGRSGKHAVAFLKGFTGCLVTDGFAGYDQVPDVTHCGCWAHMRRKWREAMPKGATVETSKAARGYEYCNKLFAQEKKYAGLSDSVRKTARQVGIEPLLDAYWLWLKTLDPVPGSKLAEAVEYAQNQKEHLCAFLEHGEVDISNNFAENAIRPFVIGRKNWLFCDTAKGAESSAIVYTLVETAKANGLDPYKYLLEILSEMPWLGRTPSQDDLDYFMPWNPKLRSCCSAPQPAEAAGDL